jgi:hypothetical protein
VNPLARNEYQDTAEIGLRDKSNPRSMINLLPSNVAQALAVIPEELLLHCEEDIRKLSRPDVLEERLRIAFWLEYDSSQRNKRQMRMSQVFGGLCSSTYFAKKIITNSFKMAFICTPPSDYRVTIEELLQLGLRQMRDILLLPHIDDNGKPDARVADVKYRIVQDLHNRVHGQVIHRVEMKSTNVNVDATEAVLPSSMTDIDAQLKQLKQDIGELPAPRDVEEVDDGT